MLNKKIAIYFDLDGVLADFGKEPNAVERFATVFSTRKSFFRHIIAPLSYTLIIP